MRTDMNSPSLLRPRSPHACQSSRRSQDRTGPIHASSSGNEVGEAVVTGLKQSERRAPGTTVLGLSRQTASINDFEAWSYIGGRDLERSAREIA
ncbi:hypothetical protein BD311DRAFT_445089 [Dichomitus squalens]|uniref:Uncharacterized protein n=1 Tax=Dichomitus squalens TaxID=114155 RepID=A0A4Q9MHV6_9APHY|nr:hypothetical protein BD311DRAFT_445089 [Dichomitus squalens]